ncbi:hypothetical protein HN51_005020 [Arachis hypogaea]
MNSQQNTSLSVIVASSTFATIVTITTITSSIAPETMASVSSSLPVVAATAAVSAPRRVFRTAPPKESSSLLLT